MAHTTMSTNSDMLLRDRERQCHYRVPPPAFTGPKPDKQTRLDAKEWAFLVISTVNIFVTVALTIYHLVEVIKDNGTTSTDFTYTILLLVNAVFFTFYVFNGLLREREFELYTLVAAIIVILGYCIIEYILTPQRTVINLARLIAVCILAPPNIVLAVVIATKFAYLEFRILGLAENLKEMYREATRFSSLLNFDLQVAASLVVLVLRHGAEVSTFEVIILAVGIPISFFWICIGWMAVRRESLVLVSLFAVLGLLEAAYVIFKFYHLYVSVYKLYTTPNDVLFSAQIVTCALALSVRGLVYIELYIIRKNFGKGLREKAFITEPTERTSLL